MNEYDSNGNKPKVFLYNPNVELTNMNTSTVQMEDKRNVAIIIKMGICPL